MSTIFFGEDYSDISSVVDKAIKDAGCSSFDVCETGSQSTALWIQRKELINTYLCRVCVMGPLESVKHLVEERWADVPINNHEPLRLACTHGHLDIVEYLVASGGNISVYTNEPVVEAAANGHLDIVEYLVSLGTDVTVNNNVTIRDAAENGQLHVVKYLVESGLVDLSQCGKQCLMNALHEGHLPVVRYLVESGVDYSGCKLKEGLGLKKIPRSRKQVVVAIDMLLANRE